MLSSCARDAICPRPLLSLSLLTHGVYVCACVRVLTQGVRVAGFHRAAQKITTALLHLTYVTVKVIPRMPTSLHKNAYTHTTHVYAHTHYTCVCTHTHVGTHVPDLRQPPPHAGDLVVGHRVPEVAGRDLAAAALPP
eukprot:1266601-Rhodomonas_salina.1